jgi:hypothetical protein
VGWSVGALLLGAGYLAGQNLERADVRIGRIVLGLIGAAGTAWTGAGVFSILT